MKPDLKSVFVRLREILQKHAGTFIVKDDTADRYSLEASAGPAALRAWRGELKRSMIPVAWVQVGKAYVSYHVMGVYENARLQSGMSKELKARMQGKTCFNFKNNDEALFQELEQLTLQAIGAFRKAGYISEQKSV